MTSTLPVDRFLATLAIVSRDGRRLRWSRDRLFERPIDAGWVESLASEPERAERREAFISRFGRMQGTIAGKLLSRWLQSLAEEPGSQIETLKRAERLGVVESVSTWLKARQLRNRLVHEYLIGPASFAADINLAGDYSELLQQTYQRVRADAAC